VSVIDTARRVLSASIHIGWGTTGVAITPDGRHAYVAGAGVHFDMAHPPRVPIPGAVSVIDTASGVVSATIALGKQNPQAVAITPDGKHVYVTGPDGYSYLPGKEDPAIDPLPIHGAVSVIDTATGAENGASTHLHHVNIGRPPHQQRVGQDSCHLPEGRRLYRSARLWLRAAGLVSRWEKGGMARWPGGRRVHRGPRSGTHVEVRLLVDRIPG
jgi:hypothetical protein